ncbi:OmpA family protein [Actibacterium sp. MT2.3-13A]|uniref:OmpA family protein n=1 Tax=Actibacterium sp. MT2.3-13A TaxID=2828332 RepID=UPI001BA93C04|nr:OmpA family protein [Actibacterium sp. MT2.3-13A]
MRLSANLIALAAVLVAGLLCVFSAVFAVTRIEERAATEIRHALAVEGLDWAEVAPDGLLVQLSGTAPSEATRFRALSITGSIVDAERVIDAMEVTPSQPINAPRFSMELLRNDSGVSLVGLIPAATDRGRLLKDVRDAVRGAPVTDLLDTARFDAPEGWEAAVRFGLEALGKLPRSKISIAADELRAIAIADSGKEKRRLETELRAAAPEGLTLVLDISAPRPVIAPFTLRFIIDESGARFDACSADTEAARDRILAAARNAGLTGKADCTIGLGVPSPNWARAVEAGIEGLAALGGGTLTFSDADVALVALDSTDQALFDRVVGETETALPEVFSLHAVKPQPVKIDGSGEGDGPPEFVATLSPEGLVQLRGRVPDELVRAATESYARSRFGLENVYAAMRLDPGLPEGWPLRVLTSLEALSDLENGSVVMQPGFVELRGTTSDEEANARIARLFADKLGEAQNFKIEVAYVAPPEPENTQPAPEDCVARVNAILEEQKITFAPGSVTVEGESLKVVDRIAEVLRECPDAQMEIGGHTDSQGREEMNLQLSQSRAEGVLSALLARRILTSNLTARGYGESQPIADNGTEEGREANRRIEFRLLLPEAAAAEAAQEAGTAAEDAPGEAPSDGAAAAQDDTAGTPADGAPAEEAETPASGTTDAAAETEEPAPDAAAAPPIATETDSQSEAGTADEQN